ncbi:transposase, IS605 OrfB [Acidithiobacillus sp. GGI-221]|nr:transposase, IS605 OrfB [Acidithiobacillus sp. GGI-221]
MKRWKRRIRRRKPGSANWRKACDQVAKTASHAKNVRNDFAHKASRSIVNAGKPLIVFEDLRIPNMVKRPAPAPGTNGRWLPNGASQKKGLTRGILDSSWGRIDKYTRQKALAKGMLCVKAQPRYSSQECSKCGHVQTENRVSQDTFQCQVCSYESNADLNAAKVLAKRGAAMVANEGYSPKKRKRYGVCRKKKKSKELGPGRPEVTLGESE